ncbi:MAG: hypothetical protein JWP57_4477 [Spirosoma sp.]|nr:hypothetical protein [Spirosoma sp.]
MTKVDLVALDKLLDDGGGDRFHPDFSKDPVTHLTYGRYPLVRVGEVYGYAVGYTREYMDVQRQDDDDVRIAWFPAADVQRVDEDDWHGRRLMF